MVGNQQIALFWLYKRNESPQYSLQSCLRCGGASSTESSFVAKRGKQTPAEEQPCVQQEEDKNTQTITKHSFTYFNSLEMLKIII